MGVYSSRRRSASRRNSAQVIMLFIYIFLCLVISLSSAIFGRATERTFNGTVTKTQVDQGNTYFVISEDGENTPTVYRNEDAWFFAKWNSSDVLRDLNVGQRYHFKVYGWRVPFLSWYPNIVSATPLPQ